MKLNFKKITAIATSVLMVGMTMGVAVAASFPSPYSSSTSAGVAIVSGTGAGVDDTVAVNSISNYLATKISSTSAPTGEKVLIKKSNEKLNLGDGFETVWGTGSAITKTYLPTILADNTFSNADNDEYDYTQKINLANITFTHFADSDYDDETPTIGSKIANNVYVANYTLDFSTDPQADVGTDLSDFESRDITILGKNYFILDFKNATTTGITLLDSAASATLSEGESTTLTAGGVTYEVSLDFVGASTAKFTVNGVQTNSLSAGGSQKVGTSYLGVKSIDSQSYAGGVKQAEFSIGTGKLELRHSNLVQMNDKNVDGLYAYITLGYSGSKRTWQKLVLTWKTSEESFLTPNADLIMPGFEAIKFSMASPTIEKTESTVVDSSENKVEIKTTIKDGYVTIPILYKTDSTTANFTGIGESATETLATSNTTHLVYNYTSDGDAGFVASWANSRDGETYFLKATTTRDTTTGINGTTISSRVSGSSIGCEVTDPASNSECAIGDNIVLTINEVLDDGTERYVNMTINSGGSFNNLYTAEGLHIYLPYDAGNGSYDSAKGAMTFTNNSALWIDGHNPEMFYLFFSEEDKNEDLTQNGFNVTLDTAGTTTIKMTVSAIGGFASSSGEETATSSKLWETYVYSDLATKLVWDKTSSDEYDVELEYHGSEVHANAYVTEKSSVPGEVGSMVFTDAEKTSWQSRDVILVGGSCINSATATALGVASGTCEAAFTTATGVGSGQYLIQSVGDAFTTGKIALVVAGYEKADTTAAASRLVNQPSTIDTTAGNKYLGVVGVEGTSTVSKVA